MEKRFSLAIRYGVEGTRLTHDHRKQYCFVKQTLLLWREILNNFFKLWHFAEKDMLSGNPYELTDTGQGLQRIQRCNNVGREMRQILAKVKNKVSSWVGSSVIHLGDHNVPNSFIFIDKYSQISRILNPVVLTIERINEISDNKPLSRYIKKQFGSAENLKMDILTDFFRHAFDGL
ncbi:hypothetical protein MHBO_001334 [Bonamia ostreae]|uniref:Non-canonical E2 ubiquitin-conjugating enzyme C-terminal domain-containing protein n=1 Tax=Bonamia ostreae TaxID=126728 RepID=A0ABV2AIL8_9EUKA